MAPKKTVNPALTALEVRRLERAANALGSAITFLDNEYPRVDDDRFEDPEIQKLDDELSDARIDVWYVLDPEGMSESEPPVPTEN